MHMLEIMLEDMPDTYARKNVGKNPDRMPGGRGGEDNSDEI